MEKKNIKEFKISQLQKGIDECDKNIEIFSKQVEKQKIKKDELRLELEIIKREQ